MDFIKKVLLNLIIVILLKTNSILNESLINSEIQINRTQKLAREVSLKPVNQSSAPVSDSLKLSESTTTEDLGEDLDYDDHEALVKKSKLMLENEEFANNRLQKLTPNSLKYFLLITIPVAIVLVILISTFWYIVHGPNCCFGKFNQVNYGVQVTESEAINRRLEELLTPI